MPISHLLLGALVALVWAGNFVAVRLGLDAGLPPVLMTALRFAAVGALAPFVPRPCGWPVLLGLGATLGLGQLGLSTLAVAAGLSPGVASLAMQTQAFFTMGLAALLLGERPGGHDIAGAGVAATGVALLALGEDVGTAAVPPLGLALVLAAAASWAAGNVLLRRAGKGAHPLAVAVWMAAVSAPCLLALSWSLEGAPFPVLAALRSPGAAAGVVAYSAAGSTLLATAVWAWLLSRHRAGRVAPLSLLVPVFGMSLSALLLGERFGLREGAAALLVLAGLAVPLLPRWRRWRARRPVG
jgi:O-acetylserine/cysteine efflux transporter